MEILLDHSKPLASPQEPPSQTPLPVRSSQRLKYEAEMGVIRKSFGDLEEIRLKLGLSRRKMAQLLLVDPSAWTRWTSPGQTAPPHIYRALQWYLLLQERFPEMTSAFWLNAVARPEFPAQELKSLREDLSTQVLGVVDRSLERQRTARWRELILTGLVAGALGALLSQLVLS